MRNLPFPQADHIHTRGARQTVCGIRGCRLVESRGASHICASCEGIALKRPGSLLPLDQADHWLKIKNPRQRSPKPRAAAINFRSHNAFEAHRLKFWDEVQCDEARLRNFVRQHCAAKPQSCQTSSPHSITSDVTGLASMPHKIPFIFVGAIAGAGLIFLATQPHAAFVGSSAKAETSDTYRQLNLFGEVFEQYAPITSTNPTTASSSNRRSRACLLASILIRVTWIQMGCAR
jgi:hypothetical protein